MTQALAHRWRFFRAGGFDQGAIGNPADLAALRGLDQKLWASLACPVQNLELNRRMLDYIDLNRDGRIRARRYSTWSTGHLARLADPAGAVSARPTAACPRSPTMPWVHACVWLRSVCWVYSAGPMATA